jgi:segregation and condensation protein B
MNDAGENLREIKKIVEAVLFSSSDPVSVTKISKVTKIDAGHVQKVINLLIEEYSARESSIEIIELGSKYIMRVKPSYYPYVEKFMEKDLDRGTLRTLAVIALKQPILLSKLAKIRGNKCYGHVKKLEELGLIKGNKKGRSKLLSTTKQFSDYFGLKSNSPEDIKAFLKNYASANDLGLEKWIEGVEGRAKDQIVKNEIKVDRD